MGIIAGFLALSVVIAVHELGHFLMAKVAKVGVPIFSIGVGPTLVVCSSRSSKRYAAGRVVRGPG